MGTTSDCHDDGMAYPQFFTESMAASGLLHTLIIGIVATIALVRFNTHPAFVVIGALVYGGLFIS